MPADDDGAPSVREAIGADARRIAALAVQLGYDVPLAHVERRLAARDAASEVFVGIVARVGVVGWVAATVRETLLSSRRAEIDGLVVDDEYRGIGLGGALVRRAEAWAARRECARIRVLSNVVRERAQAFYARAGYDLVKTESVFEKRL